MYKSLIIEIKYSGLGDHLFHSHIPRIAKESGLYDKVFLSNETKFGHTDYKKLIWEINPFVDGFVDEKGIVCDIGELVKKVNEETKENLLDQVMLYYGLDNGKRWNQPEIYYEPKFKTEFNKVIYDPNFVSWIGNVTKEYAMIFFRKNNIRFDYVMKLRGAKVMFIPDDSTGFIETKTLKDFCDLIHSSKELYCLTSGTATLAAAIGKSATVFYGSEQYEGYRHYKEHEYILIPKPFMLRLLRKLGFFKVNLSD